MEAKYQFEENKIQYPQKPNLSRPPPLLTETMVQGVQVLTWSGGWNKSLLKTNHPIIQTPHIWDYVGYAPNLPQFRGSRND